MKSAILTLMLISFLTASGCSLFKPRPKMTAGAHHGEALAVSAETTPFYHDGPQQARGPDRQLTRDTLVTLVKHAFGYSKIRLESGEQGFVANEDLKPAPDRLVAQSNGGSTDDLPPPPPVKLPAADTTPEFEPTPIPQPLIP